MTAAASSADRLVHATFRFRAPSAWWWARFTSTHPDLEVDILGRIDIFPDLQVNDVWIAGEPPGVWTTEIANLPKVVKVDCLAETGKGCFYRVVFKPASIVKLFQRLRVPLTFPLRVRAGKVVWEVVARFSEFQKILNYVRRFDPEAEVMSVRREPLRGHLPMLTEAQQRLLNDAMEAGYFAVPRKITLTELARKLNRSKSGLSKALAVIEERVLETMTQSPIIRRWSAGSRIGRN